MDKNYHFDEYELYWNESQVSGAPSLEYFPTEQTAREHAVAVLTEHGLPIVDIGSGQYGHDQFANQIYCRVTKKASKRDVIEGKLHQIAELKAKIYAIEAELATLQQPDPQPPVELTPTYWMGIRHWALPGKITTLCGEYLGLKDAPFKFTECLQCNALAQEHADHDIDTR